MVAACSAHRASDASSTSIASELGSLLLGYRSINEPRWRLRAVVALSPVCAHFGIALDPLRYELRRGVAAATCPPFWRDRLVRLLEEHVAGGTVDGLHRLVDALFARDWRACAVAAVGATLALGLVPEASTLTTAASERRYAHDLALPVLQTGCIDDEFVANVQAADSERQYRPSWLLVRACVDAIIERQQPERVRDVERLAGSLLSRERGIAEAQLARLTAFFETPAAALARARTIRERSLRAGALVLLTRSTDDVSAMQQFASAIETKLLREVAALEIARALYRRGLHRHAVRALQRVDDPRLAAERILLGAEVQLTTRHRDESGAFVSRHAMRNAYHGPAWTHVGPIRNLDAIDDLIRTAVLLRFGKRRRDDTMLVYAGNLVQHHSFCRSSRRYFIDLATRAGIELEPALLAAQNGSNSDALDALHAESIAMRAERVVNETLPESMSLGFAARSIDSNDARSPERARYDEAIALSPNASARRRVLIATAQTCLRGALANPDAWPLDVVAARLRTLVHLGGGLSVDAVSKALRTLSPHPTFTLLAFDALCRLDASAAASILLERANEISGAGIDIGSLVQLLERHAALPRGTWRAVADARAALSRHRIDEKPWLAELFVLMRYRADALLRMVQAVSSLTVIPTSPRDVVSQLDDVPRVLVALDHATIADKLAADTCLLESLLLARPASVDSTMRVWTSDEWRKLLRQATSNSTVDAPQIMRFVRRISRRHWLDALRNTDLAQLGVATSTTFDVRGTAYRLRILDKRLDVLTYLRFADVPARSCFRSDSSCRLSGDTIEAWKDPLTICCHVERVDDGNPCGFWFGSFAAVGDQPALVMNSLHVRPNGGELRIQIVQAFERTFCEPLGISHIGVANDHGGRGALPGSYVIKPVTIMRFRALSRNGQVLSRTYDDISESLNEPVLVDELFWRDDARSRMRTDNVDR